MKISAVAAITTFTIINSICFHPGGRRVASSACKLSFTTKNRTRDHSVFQSRSDIPWNSKPKLVSLPSINALEIVGAL